MVRIPQPRFFTKALDTMFAQPELRSCTVYVSDKMRVTATRLFRSDRRNTRESLMVTYGSLNYAGREFVKACKQAGEPLPVRQPQYRWWPKKKKSKK